MKNNLLIIILFLFISAEMPAQVTISEDYSIEEMMRRYKDINQKNPRITGWRIQVLASTDRRKVESAYTRFQSRFPNMPCEWKHINPYYKLQAGAYQTRLEAIAALEIIKVHYRTAFPTIDKQIRISEFINN